jgi:hypothetical protein
MRALSVRQPWAWAIFHAGKDIENRSWRTSHTVGTIAVHASTGVDPLERLPKGVRCPDRHELVRSAIIGVVDVVAVVAKSRSRWFYRGQQGWVLRNPRLLRKPIACSGKLGLWHLPPVVERRIQRQPQRSRPKAHPRGKA